VARRYLGHGFLDAALRLFARNPAQVRAEDWRRLVERLCERGRIDAAVHVCRLGGVPLPRAALLAAGDRHLRLKDLDRAIHYYELAGADRERWSALVDVLTRLPGRELNALAIAARYVAEAEAPEPPPRRAASA